MRKSSSPRESSLCLTLELPTDLTASQVVAILELLTALRERLFDYYLLPVQEYLKEDLITDDAPDDEPLRDPPF